MLSEIYQHFGLLKQQNIFDLGLEYEIDWLSIRILAGSVLGEGIFL